MKSPNPTRIDQTRRGFALVITLSLMILLAILSLGMLSLSSIALRSNGQGDAQAAARANARMALMMAIGELQTQLGPDSRISAAHDAGTTPSGGQPHWTAVYDAWKYESDSIADPASRNPQFRGWLVSGANQGTGTGEEALLVGSGSLGTSAQASDQVRVPMIAASSGNSNGRIAWWVSDEAMKAKINAGHDDSTNPSTAAIASNPLFQSQSPSHPNPQKISELETFTWQPGQRAKTISTPQVNLAAGLTGNAGVGNLNHHLTLHSAGVLADVRGGHLKRDLTNLLTRPIAEMEDKPLYLGSGLMNRFNITKDGAVSNSITLTLDNDGGFDRWGINLEELYLFHNLHRDINWATGKPRLVNKGTWTNMTNDRFLIYKLPVFEAIQFVLSFQAVQSGANYTMQAVVNPLITLSNPNDIPIVVQNMDFAATWGGLPYTLTWNIKNAAGSTINTKNSGYINANVSEGKITGGFTLEPGEAAFYGEFNTKGDKSLTRGYSDPSEGVTVSDGAWSNGFSPGTLQADDKIDFTLKKLGGSNGGDSWILATTKIGNSGYSSMKLQGDGSISQVPWDDYLTKQIKPPQSRPVSDFIKPQPVMLLTYLRNVEQSRPDPPFDAFPSRPYQMGEPAYTAPDTRPDQFLMSRHTTQWTITADKMDYTFANERMLTPGSTGGTKIYGGGARDVALGGSLQVVKRRIPLAPPISIGSFENAIATGLNFHFNRGGGTGVALTGKNATLPSSVRAIGNSWVNPFGSAANPGAWWHDPSWQVNTALWDAWFLSGIVDGQGVGSNPYQTDDRSPLAQFTDLAKGTGLLRNTRFLYYPFRSPDEAITELFDGSDLKKSALNNLSKYLLVDGAFNVNSTSVEAWKSLLASVRDQSLLDASGASKKKANPYGTLGYAVTQNTSGSEGDWNGFRDLSDTEIDTLAGKIVDQVKARGPFLSMADFINRRPDSSNTEHQALGALQVAIDKAGLNDRFTGAGRGLATADFAGVPGGGGVLIDSEITKSRAVGSAGYLSQGALLTALGSQLTVRGDTFVIRAYGDARDSSDKITAQAWCEAVVQRVPEYVDAADAPEAYNGWPGASDTLAPVNTRFGRRMEIISFRWLNSGEI